MKIAAKAVPGCRIDYAPDAGPDTRSYRVSFEKINRVLPAFKPQWDAAKGAEELYQAYRSANLDLAQFEGPKYQRIGHIRQLMLSGDLTADLRRVSPKAA